MQEFLRAILAGEGHYCITGLKKNDQHPAIQSFFDKLEDTDQAIKTFLSERRDVYFALATFKDPNAPKPRAQENVVRIKSLWIDIDCGEEKAKALKGYLDKEAALLALEEFLIKTKLPEPALVDSGGGIHGYWVLDRELSREEWQPLADGLKELCLKEGLLIDAGCTADAARILRVPNTYNFKEETPRQVRLLSPPDTTYSVDIIKSVLPEVAPKPLAGLSGKKNLSPLTKALMGNQVCYFKNIMLRTAKGTGCQQLAHIYQNQHDSSQVDYNMWRAALSVAEHCEDRDRAIHKLSEKHPNYDPTETENKASDTRGEGKGPFLCTTFSEYRPGGCDGCKHLGKIKSPIVLGREIAESKETEVTVKEESASGTVNEIVYEIPELPDPYFRGRKGGIYRRGKDDDQVLVYPHDLYVVQRIYDPNEGESAWMRLHLPRDGVKNFTVSMATLSGPDTMRTELSKRGVISMNWKEIQAYLIRSAGELQVQKQAEVAHHQFGWTKRGSFVVGDMELESGKRRYVPPTVTTSDMVDWYHEKGNIEEWKKVFNAYAKEGMEAQGFAALTGFGAPLLKIASNHKGILLNLIHKDSGSGKTTVLRVINSIWGHPEEPLRSADDTKASMVLRMGVLNNIPLTVDEMTNTKPEEVSNFLYGITQGRGRDRMNSNSNTLRVNTTTWRTVGVATSNSSFHDKLYLLKDLPKGEIFRCVEFHMGLNNIISTKDGVTLFDEILMENYGHAWYPYITAVQSNKAATIDLVKKYFDAITDKLNLSPSYRFYSALGAVNLAGGKIAQDLGLIDYPLQRLFDFYCGQIDEIRETTLSKGQDSEVFISMFILKYMAQNALIIDDACDARTGMVSKQTPRDELSIRMEPDTKRIYIVASKLKDECAKNQVTYKEVIKDLETKGYLIGIKPKGMSKGTLIGTPPVSALVLDAEKMGFEIPTDPSEDALRQD